MKRTISFKAAVAVASVSVFAACTPAGAQDAATGDAAGDAVAEAPAEKAFAPMMRCSKAEGLVEVLKPRTEEWERVAKGHFYPLGTEVRLAAADASAEFSFGEKSTISAVGVAEFGTREVEFGAQERAVVLKGGRVNINLPRTLGEGLFKVVAPAFCCENLAGESRFDYKATGDGDEVVVRCVTGTMALKGAHFSIPKMGAANQICLRTTGDQLFTSLRGESGDCKVILDMGLAQERNFETGELKDAPRSLEFALSPKCAIKIFRAKSTVGGRMSVSVMTFGASGNMLNRFAFSEGRSNVNSGELVISTKVAEEKDAAKKADADEEETIEAKPAAKGKSAKAKDDEEEEEKDEDKDDEKKDEKKDDSDDK